jgi:hypothetical protein
MTNTEKALEKQENDPTRKRARAIVALAMDIYVAYLQENARRMTETGNELSMMDEARSVASFALDHAEAFYHEAEERL